MVDDPNSKALANRAQPAEQDEAVRLERTVEAIRRVLKAPREKESAAGQLHVWMEEDEK